MNDTVQAKDAVGPPPNPAVAVAGGQLEEQTAAEDGSSSSSSWIDNLVFNGIKWALENELSAKSSGYGDADADGGGSGIDVTTIVAKLQDMMQIVASKTSEVCAEDIPWYAYLSLIQLNEAIKRHKPEYRDNSYRDQGTTHVTTNELVELSEGVELAEAAYEENYFVLKKKLSALSFALLRHDTSVEPGRVAHYIAINHARRVVVVGLKGTSTFSDLVTDATGKTTEYTLVDTFDGSYLEKQIRCHEGIYTAALTVADDVEELVEHLFLPSGYQVLLCGHSLGAGTACLLGLILRSRIPALRVDGGGGGDGGDRDGGDDEHRRQRQRLRVIAVATPPVLNHSAAVAISTFTTSLMNNNDIVPRMSLSNLVTLAKILVVADERLKARDIHPHDVASAVAYAQFLTRAEEEPIMTEEEVDTFFDEHSKRDYLDHVDNLFVPGRVVAMWYVKKTEGEINEEKSQGEEDKCEAKVNDDEEGLPQEKTEEQLSEERLNAEIAKFKAINAIAGTSSMRMLRQLELESTFLDDHGTEAYRASIGALIRKRMSIKLLATRHEVNKS